ncbi:SEC-C metal-binding domain-containing protein [Candidatus Palauibacter sp.]|uniref:SEC-C metal-binding domain-containing protein n=1 Tax=Candidatus Palauibacter sp. TaxID=3101350 RepID=UPI003C6FC938
MQAYRELLAPLGPEPATPSVIVGFIRFLARRNEPGGHEACPCGSGTRLRNCHQPLLRELRITVAPEHATIDRDFLTWAAQAQQDSAQARSVSCSAGSFSASNRGGEAPARIRLRDQIPPGGPRDEGFQRLTPLR